MPSDDELRRVAEDVRALVHSLMRDLREGFENADHASRDARRQVREDVRAMRLSLIHI